MNASYQGSKQINEPTPKTFRGQSTKYQLNKYENFYIGQLSLKTVPEVISP